MQDVSSTPRSTSKSRPYRSHIVPACDECRRSKIRCIVDMSGPPCQMCRKRQTECQINTRRQKIRASRGHIVGKTALKYQQPQTQKELGEGLSQFPSVTGVSPTESSVLLNPTMAQDVEVLERYLTAQGQPTISSSRPYRTIWNSLGKPIIYLTVPRYRQGFRSEFDPGRTQREILENILGPLKSELINVYVRVVKFCLRVQPFSG